MHYHFRPWLAYLQDKDCPGHDEDEKRALGCLKSSHKKMWLLIPASSNCCGSGEFKQTWTRTCRIQGKKTWNECHHLKHALACLLASGRWLWYDMIWYIYIYQSYLEGYVVLDVLLWPLLVTPVDRWWPTEASMAEGVAERWTRCRRGAWGYPSSWMVFVGENLTKMDDN